MVIQDHADTRPCGDTTMWLQDNAATRPGSYNTMWIQNNQSRFASFREGINP